MNSNQQLIEAARAALDAIAAGRGDCGSLVYDRAEANALMRSATLLDAALFDSAPVPPTAADPLAPLMREVAHIGRRAAEHNSLTRLVMAGGGL